MTEVLQQEAFVEDRAVEQENLIVIDIEIFDYRFVENDLISVVGEFENANDEQIIRLEFIIGRVQHGHVEILFTDLIFCLVYETLNLDALIQKKFASALAVGTQSDHDNL